MVACWPEVQASISSLPAASCASAGDPFGCAGPGGQGACPATDQLPPATGPVSTSPEGVSRYPVVPPAMTRPAEDGAAVVIAWKPAGTETGVHDASPACEVYSENEVQLLA